MDTSGFYKLEEGAWFYAPNFVYSRDYTLEREGNRTSIDGWQWYDEAPIEYTQWYEANFPANNELI
jgi:hypothetical protein